MPFLHLLMAAGIGFGLFMAVRWIGSQSITVQALVAGGLLCRAVLGVSLFWISYLRLPVLPSLQLGTGFWMPMKDALGYFTTATVAVERGLSTISAESPSPFFSRVLAVWMHLVGVSPCAALLLNLCLYVGCCALLTYLFKPVGRRQPDLPLLIVVATISFSPVLVIDSTQALKDDLFFSLIVVICAAAMLMFRPIVGTAGEQLPRLAAAGCMLAGAIYGVAGIRPYYPVIVFGCLLVVLTGLAFTLPPGQRLRRLSTGVLLLAAFGYIYWTGAGSQVRPNPKERQRIIESLQGGLGLHAVDAVLKAATSAVTTARNGFIISGGGTNVADEQDGAATTALGIGLAVIVVPISILKATSLVDFQGGRGLLAITDLDTVFMDCSLIGIGYIAFRRRQLIGDRRVYVWFGLVLALFTALLLGYVVTNFGTLFRMRYLVSTPLWMLVLALSPRHLAGRSA